MALYDVHHAAGFITATALRFYFDFVTRPLITAVSPSIPSLAPVNFQGRQGAFSRACAASCHCC
jgi:hypothetical protein